MGTGGIPISRSRLVAGTPFLERTTTEELSPQAHRRRTDPTKPRREPREGYRHPTHLGAVQACNRIIAFDWFTIAALMAPTLGTTGCRLVSAATYSYVGCSASGGSGATELSALLRRRELENCQENPTTKAIAAVTRKGIQPIMNGTARTTRVTSVAMGRLG